MAYRISSCQTRGTKVYYYEPYDTEYPMRATLITRPELSLDCLLDPVPLLPYRDCVKPTGNYLHVLLAITTSKRVGAETPPPHSSARQPFLQVLAASQHYFRSLPVLVLGDDVHGCGVKAQHRRSRLLRKS